VGRCDGEWQPDLPCGRLVGRGFSGVLEKVIFDVELIQHIVQMLQPIDTQSEELGVEAIGAVDPGGHFFGAEHTMSRYETAFYSPILSDWQNNENWVASGAKDATMRATDVWQSVLAEAEAPPLDVARQDALTDYVARRKREIGSGEP